MSALSEIAALPGFSVRRAWPRSPDHLLLDLRGPSGDPVAGQWLGEPGRAAEVARRTGAGSRAVGRVLLQPGGADRRLPALSGLLREDGAVLVAHRPERRAVVHRGDGTYAKVVRPERTAEVARAARAAGDSGLRVPQVLDVREGVVTTAPLPGRTLHDLLRAGSSAVLPAAREIGRTLAALHRSPLPPGVAVRDGAAEGQVLRRWTGLAHAHGVGDRGAEVAALRDPPAPLVPVHRDLHDKQLLVDGDGSVGVLDFDLAAAGEAALDLANLLVHLELRAHQGVCSTALAAAAAAAVLDGYAPGPDVERRLAAYDQAARRRLVAVYGFRPGSRAAAGRLLDPEQVRRSRAASAAARA